MALNSIGILGGSFNPIHLGHLVTAEYVRTRLRLNKVIFIPTNVSPHKNPNILIEARHRFNMVKLAIKGNDGFRADAIEIKRGGTSYTVDTLKEFRRRYPVTTLNLIIGSDSIVELNNWKDIDTICALAKIIVVTRQGFSKKAVARRNIIYLQTPVINISSSQIRERIRVRQSIKYMVPFSVERYIIENNLYR